MESLEDKCIDFICFKLWRNYINYFNDIAMAICRSYRKPNFDIFTTLINCWNSVLECDSNLYQNLAEPPTKRTKLMLAPPDVWLSELEIPIHLAAQVLTRFKFIFFEIGIWFLIDVLILVLSNNCILPVEFIFDLLIEVKCKMFHSYSGFLLMTKMFKNTCKRNQY